MKVGSLDLPQDRIAAFCKRWQVRELSMFGSALRGELRPDSDIDLLIAFQPEATWGLLDHAQMTQELTDILGREVDLVSRRGVERSHNIIRRRAILNSAEPVYVAR